jgi:hypothetical protein
MKNKLFCAFIVLFVVLSTAPARASLIVLEGEHTVVYDIVNPRGVAFIPDYSNESFVQKVVSRDEYSTRLQVSSKMHPLTSRVPFPMPPGRVPAAVQQYLQPERDRQSNDPAIARLSSEITRGSRYAHEAADAILSYVADTITFDTSIAVPSDAVSALRYRKAYCVGYSNLSVALLRAAGIPARVAHGYLPPGYEWGFSKEYWGVKVNDGGFHAYLEIFYPDTGWVFSDAEHSHHFVDPFHIILRLDGMDMPGAYAGGHLEVDKATFFTIVSEENRTTMVDELPLPRQKRLGRRLDGRQHASLVTGRVLDKSGRPVPRGTAVVWKEGRGVPAAFVDGQYAVVIQDPGTYRIELKGPGFAKASQDVTVEQAKRLRLDFTLPSGGVIKGTVRNAAGSHVSEGDVFYRDGRVSYGVPVDSDGTYRIEGLAPGSYTVKAVVGEKEVSKPARVDAGKEIVVDFVVQ